MPPASPPLQLQKPIRVSKTPQHQETFKETQPQQWAGTSASSFQKRGGERCWIPSERRSPWGRAVRGWRQPALWVGWAVGACSPVGGRWSAVPTAGSAQGETASPRAGGASAQLMRHRPPHCSTDFLVQRAEKRHSRQWWADFSSQASSLLLWLPGVSLGRS